MVAQLGRALRLPFGEAAAARAVLAKAPVQELQHLVLGGAHTVVVDELGLSQLEQARQKGARLGKPLRPAALGELGNRLDIEVDRVERVTARRAVGAHVGGVQGVHADHACAEARRKLDQRPQVAEIPDAPVALRAHAVKLDHETPGAAAFREKLGLMARALLDRHFLWRAPRPERLLERAARLRLQLVFALPDVEVARRDLAQPIHQPALQGSRRRPLPFPQSRRPPTGESAAIAASAKFALRTSPSQATSKARSPSMR